MPVEAIWSNWWGSPELFAAVAEEFEKALDRRLDSATVSIVLTNPHRQYVFPDSSAFRAAPAEHVRGFRKLSARCQADGWSASFELSRPSLLTSRSDHATLRVEAADEEEEEESALLSELVPVVEEGYQPYWGGATVPESARAGAKRRSPVLSVVRPVVDFALAAFLGAALYLATRRFGIPFIAPLAGLVGLLVPPMIEVVVPRVEIAPQGQTRLRVIRKRLVGTLLATIGTWVIGLFTGT